MTGGVFILSVSFDVEALGGRAADTAMPAEAINYFCEIRMEEELERARTRTREKTPVQAQDNSRNTVLVLPKIHRFVSNSNIDCETTLKRHVSKSSRLSFWFLFFNSRSRNVEQKIKILHHKTVMIWNSLFFQQTESRAAGRNTLQSLSPRKRDVSCIE